MTSMNIAAPLAAALAARGYETLTAVQQAMLADDVAGRDLLVSAQTGSGKTVAFGIAMAPELLRGAERMDAPEKPVALVIAPTRELALQVARELEWLYAEAGAKVATCVGGMDFRNERRALERGAHIVVGTPGRLRDHIERGSLDLSGLTAAVLDEADEMLDLGFAEDLEFILSAAPEERRTLMFSATVSKEIARLAENFQKDALRIKAQGEARQHVDIEYRVLTAAGRDRENAIFNVLRFYEAQTAIIFCKTRANVSHLMAQMGDRGMHVVALSGELSQKERMHALQALRDGRARICIATDVAARGIDLPGLELVIHADLPTDHETLLHRSGRTGRAGKKGTSVLLASPAESRRAQRLLANAKIEAEWANAPTADEVLARDNERLLTHPALHAPAGDDQAMAEQLLQGFGAVQVASAFIRLWREGRAAPEELAPVEAFRERREPREPREARAPREPKERREFGASVWFELSIGSLKRAAPGWILPKICEKGNITKAAIGAIRVKDEVTFVQITEAEAANFTDGFELQSGIRMRRLDGAPDLSAPQAPRERAPYKRKPSRFVEEEQGEAPAAPERKAYEKKPWAKREEEGERKPYEKKPYEKKAYEKKPFAKREGEPKPHWKAKPEGAPGFKKSGPAKGKFAPKGKPRPQGDVRDASKRYAPPKKKH